MCLELVGGVLTEDVVIEVMVFGGEGISACK